MSMRFWILAGIGWWLALLCGAGCGSERARRAPENLPDDAVAILEPVDIAPVAQVSMRWLNGLFPKATRLSAMSDPGDALARVSADCVLIIPSASHLPVHWWRPLQDYLARGNPVLFWGTRPFEARVRVENGRARTGDDVALDLAASARAAGSLSDVRTWRHENSRGDLRGEVRLVEPGKAPWPAIRIEVEALDEWDYMVFQPVPKGVVIPGENSLAFYARGSIETSQLVVECEEEDGSRWGSVVEVGPDWKAFLLHQSLFRPLGGGLSRGRAGDGFHLERIKRVAIGLVMALAPQRPGAHEFGLSDVRLAADSRPADEAAGWPDIALVSPPPRRFTIEPGWLSDPATGDLVGMLPTRAESPLPLPRGLGGATSQAGRWIPLFSVMDNQREIRGWPASLFVVPGDPQPAGRWGWIGVDADRSAREATEHMIITAVRRLRENLVLQFAGCDRYAYPPGVELRAAAQWLGDPNRTPALRVAAELRRAEDGYLLRRVVNPAGPPGRPMELNLGLAPPPAGTTEDYVVRIALEDAYQHGRLNDVIEHAVKVAAPANATPVTTAGASFLHNDLLFFPVGVHYLPIRAEPTTRYSWMDRSLFDPDAVRRDLARLKKIGMNTIFIEYRDEQEAPQLRYVVEEARRQNLFIIASVAGLNPLAPDWALARRLALAADLPNDPQIFALDLDMPPDVGNHEIRRTLDPAWRNWLAEQYGSVQNAESVLDGLWKERGEPAGPPDEALRPDAASSALVAAYRRFLQDLTSRRVGWLRRQLAGLGCRQLLTARFGGLPGSRGAGARMPIDPAWGAVHLDFLSLSLTGSTDGDPARGHAAVFAAVYARGVSNGKPVVWHGGGVNIGRHPRSADLGNQARVLNDLFDVVLRSRTAGCVGWSFPGGWRAGEWADTGLMQPDGAWRPAGLAFRNFITRTRQEQRLPAAWRGREMERAACARGLSAIWEQWHQPYSEELAANRLEEVRPAGFGRPVGELFAGALGETAPAPPDVLNAEWGSVEVDGVARDRAPGEPIHAKVRQVIRAELINTGPAVWAAPAGTSRGQVRAILTLDKGTPEQLPVRALSFGERDRISWLVTDAGAWQSRPEATGIGSFGEVLRIVADAPTSQ